MSVDVTFKDELAVVTIDNPPVNATSQLVRQGLLDAVTECDSSTQVKAVILMASGRTFVAGADIREFGKPMEEPHLPAVLNAIENADKPWVAAIHGFALGGGLELAMACRARIAQNASKVGLPEVNLGLIPGAGGTVRLPRLVSAEFALNLAASGKPISAAIALEQGLVDGVCTDKLLEKAQEMARKVASDQRENYLPTLSRPVRINTDDTAFTSEKDRLLKKARGQLSIRAAAEAIERALHLPASQALAQERETFFKLKESEQSNALRYLFFAERETLKDPRCKATPRQIEKIGIVGGGTMGSGITVACLLANYQVCMIEMNQAAANAGNERVQEILQNTRKRGLIDDDRLARLRENFACSIEFESLHDTKLVIEAVYEDMEVKQQVFKKLDGVAHESTILASNTSYLDVNEIAGVVNNPGRVIGLHFFSPAHIMKLLEIVLPDAVADDVIASAVKVAKRLKKTAVLSGVCDGFIGNRIMGAYRQETDYLIEDGALPDDVDRAMREFGFPMGIYEMQDLAGLDIGWANRKRLAATRDPSERYVDIADKICELGRFGRKTGLGWYNYSTGKPVVDPLVTDIIVSERSRKQLTSRTFTDDEIIERILRAMQSEAKKVLQEGIAQKSADIDVVMTAGYSFPRWKGGPMFMLDNPAS